MLNRLKRLFGSNGAPLPARSSPRSRPSRSNGQPQPAAFADYFEALRASPDRTPLTPAVLGAGGLPMTAGWQRVRLSALARALYDNGGFVGYAVNQIAFYSAPIIPQAASDDDAWNRQAEAYFADWARRADFYGRPGMDFWALQVESCQAIDLDGDIGALMTAEAGFPQVQLINGHRIGSANAGAEENVVDGVRLDAKGRVLGYLIADAGGEPLDVPASLMMLVRDPCVASPLRGLPPMRRGLNDIRDARDILGFEKLAVKQNSSLIGVLEGPGPIPADEGQAEFDTKRSEDEDTATSSVHRADLYGGDIPVLEEGREFKRVESGRPNAQFGEFLESLVAQFAAGLDIPPAFFLDAKLTGPNARAVNGKAQRKFDQRQTVLCRFTEWVWSRLIGWAIETGELPNVDGWWRLTFQRPARLTIDAGREAQQEREDQNSGLMTRQELYGNRAKDWERETDQCFIEVAYIIERAKELAASSGVPLETVLARFGFDGRAGSVGSVRGQATATASNPDPGD